MLGGRHVQVGRDVSELVKPATGVTDFPFENGALSVAGVPVSRPSLMPKMSRYVRGGIKHMTQPDSSGHSVMMVWWSCDFCCMIEQLRRGGGLYIQS